MEILGLILARGGSKSIPKKNIYPCAGNPLLYYTIKAARGAKCINRLIISTDDEEIAEVARSYGVEVPFRRPRDLAEDLTPDFPVVKHALAELKKQGYAPDAIVHLRPTTPFKASADIDKGIRMLGENPDADSVRSICEPLHTPFKMYHLVEGEKFLRPLLTKEFPEVFTKYAEPFNMPRQALPKVWRHSGYIDIIRAATVLEKNSMSGTKILPLFFEEWRDVDIDSMKELQYAEHLILSLKEKGKEIWQNYPRL